MSNPPLPYTLRQISAALGRSPRTLRGWIGAGLLPSSHSRGPGTRYDDAFLLRARAVDLLLRGRATVADAKKQLAGATPETLARMVTPAKRDPEPLATLPAPTYAATTWERVVLWDGLELHVRADRAPLRRIAQQIVDAFAATNSLRP